MQEPIVCKGTFGQGRPRGCGSAVVLWIKVRRERRIRRSRDLPFGFELPDCSRAIRKKRLRSKLKLRVNSHRRTFRTKSCLKRRRDRSARLARSTKNGKGRYNARLGFAHWLLFGASQNRFKLVCREKTTYGITFPTTNHF